MNPIRRRRLGGGVIAPLQGYSQLTAGSSQFWSITDNASLSGGSGIDMTWAGWMRVDTYPASTGAIFIKFGGAGSREYECYYDTATKKVHLIVSANGTANSATVNSTAVLGTGTWHFIMAQYDGTNIKLSVDNGAVDSVAFSTDIFDSTQRFAFNGTDDGNNFWTGRHAGWGVWRSARGAGAALTAAQITALYNNRKALAYRGLPGSLKTALSAFWDFEVDGNDRSGANTLTNNGGIVFGTPGPS